MLKLKKRIRLIKVKILRKEYVFTSRRYMEKTIFDMGRDISEIRYSFDVLTGKIQDSHTTKWHINRINKTLQKIDDFSYDCLDELIH